MAAGSSAAVALSIIALSEAEKAKCMAAVNGYQHNTATVEQMQHYAKCIGKLHPADLTPDAVVAWKFVVAVLLLGFIGGAVVGWVNRSYSWFEDMVLGALGGVLLTGGGMLVVALLYMAFGFLFS